MRGGYPFTSVAIQEINRIIMGVYENYSFVSIQMTRQVKGRAGSAFIIRDAFRHLCFSACRFGTRLTWWGLPEVSHRASSQPC